MSENFLYQITKENLEDKEVLNYIYENREENYYLSYDFSIDTYIKLCKYGFISTSIELKNTFYLLPEIQFEYAVLDFKNLHISKKVKKLLKQNNFIFKVNYNLNLVLEKLEEYHKDNWLKSRYKQLIIELFNKDIKDFQILCFELYDKNNTLIAGEIGYKIAKTYTSLSGFSSKDKSYDNWGKLQLVLLARYLENNSFVFWNLGHPYMQYKFDLGATLYSREEFLNRWLKAIF